MATTSAFTSAGTKLYISDDGPPASFDQTGYEALTWTEIGDITSMGEFGRTYEDITHQPVGSRQTFHFKGGYDDGGLQLEMAHAPDDAGQVIVATALDDDDNYHFKLEYNDNPSGLTNTIDYFPAKVMSAPKSIGGVNSLTTKTVNVMLNGDIVPVAATDS